MYKLLCVEQNLPNFYGCMANVNLKPNALKKLGNFLFFLLAIFTKSIRVSLVIPDSRRLHLYLT